MSYVKAARELPFLSPEEVEQEAIRYGLVDTAADGASAPEKESSENNDSSSQDVVNEGPAESGLGDGVKTSE